MKKHPLKVIGIVFSIIAMIELIVLVTLLAYCAISQNKQPLTVALAVLIPHILIFGGIGFGFLCYARKRERLREELLAGGYAETAQVVHVEQVWSVTINRRHPFRVICRINRDGVLHEYRSDMLPEEPALQPGDEVRVYLDRRDENRYYVDVPSAAPMIIRH